MLLVDFSVIHSREEGIHLHSSHDIVDIQQVDNRGENGKRINRLVNRMNEKIIEKACTLLLQGRLIEEVAVIIEAQRRWKIKLASNGCIGTI